MGFIECVKKDLERKIHPASLRNFFRIYFSFQGTCFRIVFWLRVVQFTKKREFLRFLVAYPAMFIFRAKEKKLGIYINTNIEIGEGLSIVHPGCVFVNAARIGKNCTIYQNVTIGSKPNEIGLPKIGDNVQVYVGSVVCGNISIEDNVLIGANSYIGKSVPSNAIVHGARSVVIER